MRRKNNWRGCIYCGERIDKLFHPYNMDLYSCYRCTKVFNGLEHHEYWKARTDNRSAAPDTYTGLHAGTPTASGITPYTASTGTGKSAVITSAIWQKAIKNAQQNWYQQSVFWSNQPGQPIKEIPPLEVVKQTEPVKAWKLASGVDLTNKVIYPINQPSPYKFEDHAGCNKEIMGHSALSPDEHCHCGFYAVKNLNSSELYEGTFILEVELYGKIIEGELGYRAQYQRVLDIFPINQRVEELVRPERSLFNVPNK